MNKKTWFELCAFICLVINSILGWFDKSSMLDTVFILITLLLVKKIFSINEKSVIVNINDKLYAEAD